MHTKATKWSQMLTKVPCLSDTIWDFVPKWSQILWTAPRVHSNTTKCNQMLPNASMTSGYHMGLCSEVYPHVPKYSQTPSNTSNTTKCPRVFLHANNNKRYQMLQDAQVLPCLYEATWHFAPKRSHPPSANTFHTQFLQTSINKATTTPNSPTRVLIPSAPSPFLRTPPIPNSLKITSTKLQEKTSYEGVINFVSDLGRRQYFYVPTMDYCCFPLEFLKFLGGDKFLL